MKIIFSTFLIFFLSHSFAQENDTLSVNDTLQTVLSDTLNSTEDDSYGVDSVITASANDSIIFLVDKKMMKLYGSASINYKQTDIKSANIIVDFDKGEIDAEGVPSDSVEGEMTGNPVLSEADEVYEGINMKYNFRTGRGYISYAQTEQEGAYYTGEKINKVSRETYFIEDGIYTTCDDECPHYHFYAQNMKVIEREQMVAKWIFLNFGGVPFPVPLPFAVFPIQSGRRSGLLAPAFGDDPLYGTYFSRFGYFWAISDYMDVNLTADYYTRGSYKLNSRFRYKKKYDFDGNLEGSYAEFIQGEETDPDRSERVEWRAQWNHNQQITPTMRFDARLEFLSNNRIQRNISNINEILRNEAVSNATFFKRWDESGNSLSINYNRRQVFETNEIFEILPRVTFTKSQSYPFRSGSNTNLWYESFGYSYTGTFQNNRNKVDGDLKIRGGIQHNVNTSISPKIGYFSISPSLRYQERWYNKRVEKFAVLSSQGTDSIITNDVNEINFVRSFSAGINASTKFFGIFQPNMLGISAIRHVVNPTISYNYQPDFSSDFWGFYDSYVNSAGQQVLYNKFEREIFGGPSASEVQSINFSVSNIFEMKTEVDPTDTTSSEEKIQLLNLTAGTGYNFAADSLNFADIRLSYRTQIGSILNFSGSSSFTPYDYSGNISKVNKFLINEGKGLLRLTNFSISISTSISGERLKSTDDEVVSDLTAYDGRYESERSIYQGLYNDGDPDFAIPWDITLNYNFTENRPTPERITKSSNLSGSFNFNLTPKWKFSVTGSYDIERDEFAAPQIRVSRDLHCWIMNFTWIPVGTLTGYRFEIRVKAPQLQDLKITKRDQFFEGR